MTISNVIVLPRVRSRVYDIRLNLKRASRKLSTKITKIYYGSTRTPFPELALSRVLEASFQRRLDTRPGDPAIANFDNIVLNAGFPSAIHSLYGLVPSGYIHRVSDEQTIIYRTRRGHEAYIYRYMQSSVLLNDIDVLRAWFVANKHQNHMLSTFRVDKYAKLFNYTLTNHVTYISGNLVQLALNSREIRPSCSAVVLFLFAPQVLNYVSDYDIANNIKFDATVTHNTFNAATEDLLNWFFFGGHAVPKVPVEPQIPPTPPVVQDLGSPPDSISQKNQSKTGRSNNDVSKPKNEGRGFRPSPRIIESNYILEALDVINKNIRSKEIRTEFIKALALMTV